MTSRKFSRKRIVQALGLLVLGLALLVGSASYGRIGGDISILTADQEQEAAAFSLRGLADMPHASVLVGLDQQNQPDITVSPPTFEFGPVVVGQTKPGRVRLLNVGQAELVISAATLVGFPSVVVGFSTPLKLAPGAEAELQIDFKPTAEGTLKGALELASNDPDEPKVSLALRGTGIREIVDLTVTSNTTWKGDVFAQNITVAKGVTITATEDLTVYATGNLQFDGDLTGECRAVRIFVEQKAVINGRIQNRCSVEQVFDLPNAVAPGITLVAPGGLILAGPLTAMGDPIIVSHQFLIPSAKELSYLLSPSSGGAMADSGGAPSEAQETDNQPEKYDVEIRAPISAVMGGSPLLMWQDQVVLIDAGISAGDGLPGKPGTAEQTIGNSQGGVVEVKGPNGGPGGNVVIRVPGRGQVNVGRPGGPPIPVRSGNGAPGGPARAVGDSKQGKPNASAIGGNGGIPGSVWLIAPEGASMNIVGPVGLTLGDGGNGGESTAEGAVGDDGCPGKLGGDAKARGGKGASFDAQVIVRGIVRGLQNVTVSGGRGGKGGDATATAGNGGNSNCCAPNNKGGKGGDAEAEGGKGGDVTVDTRGYPVQVAAAPSFQGGNGGNATATGGTGGNGKSGCCTGGKEGAGGKATAEAGKPGTGRVIHPPMVQRRDGRPGTPTPNPGARGKPGIPILCLPRFVIDLVFNLPAGWKDCEVFSIPLLVSQAADSSAGGTFLAAAHERLNALGIIDLATRQIKMIQVGLQPHSVEISKDGRRAFVGNFGSGDLSIVDLANQRVLETIRVGRQTAALALDPNANKLYATNFGDNNVSIVQYQEGGSQVVGTVRDVRQPLDIKLSPDGRRGYVSSQRVGEGVAVIDTAAASVVARIAMPNLELRRLAVSPDGQRLYVATRTDVLGTGQIAVVDTTSLQIVQRIPVESFPLNLTLTPQGGCLIVTHAIPNKVSFVDLKSAKVLAVLEAGGEPQYAAISGDLVYVTNLRSDKISVYNLGSCQ